jgi:GDPmannose 4,6-dehydratase
MMKSALISGTTGQDGADLARLLSELWYRVVGAERRASNRNRERLDELGVTDEIEYVEFDLADSGNIVRVLERIEPDEVYKLGARSLVTLSFEQPIITGDVDGIGATRLLGAIPW